MSINGGKHHISRIRNAKVGGSTPLAGTRTSKGLIERSGPLSLRRCKRRLELLGQDCPGSDRKISTRRFAARPASVSLLATGSCEPRPAMLTREDGTPRAAR